MLEPTADQLELISKIKQKYFQLGTEQGFSKVVLDQVASELSISKKTLYKYFSGKEDIISACIDDVFATIDEEIMPIMTSPTLGIIDKITKLPAIVAKHLQFFSSEQVVDIQRAFPQLWTKVTELRSQKIARYEALIQAAQSQDLLIDVDSKILLEHYLMTIEAFTKESFISKHGLSYAQASQLVNHIILNGILRKDEP